MTRGGEEEGAAFPVEFQQLLEPYLDDATLSAFARTCSAHMAIAYFRCAKVLGWGESRDSSDDALLETKDLFLLQLAAKLHIMVKGTPEAVQEEEDYIRSLFTRAEKERPTVSPMTLSQFRVAWRSPRENLHLLTHRCIRNSTLALTGDVNARVPFYIASGRWAEYKALRPLVVAVEGKLLETAIRAAAPDFRTCDPRFIIHEMDLLHEAGQCSDIMRSFPNIAGG